MINNININTTCDQKIIKLYIPYSEISGFGPRTQLQNSIQKSWNVYNNEFNIEHPNLGDFIVQLPKSNPVSISGQINFSIINKIGVSPANKTLAFNYYGSGFTPTSLQNLNVTAINSSDWTSAGLNPVPSALLQTTNNISKLLIYIRDTGNDRPPDSIPPFSQEQKTNILAVTGSVYAYNYYNLINLKLSGSTCCKESNTVSIPLPPIPPPPPPTVDKCLEVGSNLINHIVKVTYDPIKCGGGHDCNAALFDLYINNIWIGQANLNNAGGSKDPGGKYGGYRESIFTIKDNIIASPGFSIELRCVYDRCHSGIGRVDIFSPEKAQVFGSCLKTDSIITKNILCN